MCVCMYACVWGHVCEPYASTTYICVYVCMLVCGHMCVNHMHQQHKYVYVFMYLRCGCISLFCMAMPSLIACLHIHFRGYVQVSESGF